jgi:hypothetical protein
VALEEHPERIAVTGARTRPQNGVVEVHRLFMSDHKCRVPDATVGNHIDSNFYAKAGRLSKAVTGPATKRRGSSRPPVR